jgi:hypothetical protein
VGVHAAAALERLVSMGAKEYEPLTRRGERGSSPLRW